MSCNRCIIVFSLAILVGGARAEIGAPVHLEWDAVADSRVDHYQVHYGRVSGRYERRTRTVANAIEIAGLQAGVTYYFAARACNRTATECSDFSNELQAIIPPRPMPVAAVVAAPVVLAPPRRPAAQWSEPRQVSAASAVATIVEPAAALDPIEIGTVDIDPVWQRIDFQQPFNDPVVVVKSLSANDSAPAVIRLDAIDSEGFWVRVQEWDALDGRHACETVTYLAMERGRHRLPDGAWVEAGSLETSATETADTHAFSAPFDSVPVVFAAVASVIEEDAVIARLHAIDRAGFQISLREQEANAQIHLAERIDYIAWEASTGEIAGLSYTVGRTGARIGGKPVLFIYPTAFEQAPMLVADLQTANDRDPASLRWSMQNEQWVVLKAQEEQSQDQETNHANEDVGYFIAGVAE